MIQLVYEKGDTMLTKHLTKSKFELKKEEKKQRLLDAAYALFISKGFKDTTIQNIVDQAGVAKGTFYLYYHDRYEIQEHVITFQAKSLFQHALKSLEQTKPSSFEDRVIAIVDHVIDELISNHDLLQLIRKNLSAGLFEPKLVKLLEKENSEIIQAFEKDCATSNIKISNPQILLFMIIELAGSSCYNCILFEQPMDIISYKPYLYKAIRAMLHMEEL